MRTRRSLDAYSFGLVVGRLSVLAATSLYAALSFGDHSSFYAALVAVAFLAEIAISVDICEFSSTTPAGRASRTTHPLG